LPHVDDENGVRIACIAAIRTVFGRHPAIAAAVMVDTVAKPRQDGPYDLSLRKSVPVNVFHPFSVGGTIGIRRSIDSEKKARHGVWCVLPLGRDVVVRDKPLPGLLA
jgi:hypothetical protein